MQCQSPYHNKRKQKKDTQREIDVPGTENPIQHIAGGVKGNTHSAVPYAAAPDSLHDQPPKIF
jgi:hypothetical protein